MFKDAAANYYAKMVVVQSRVANLRMKYLKEKIKTEKLRQGLLEEQYRNMKMEAPTIDDSTDDDEEFEDLLQ